jgi:uncharacterized protein YbaR (Trm112 family)
MDILACPMCKSWPLELHIFKETDEVDEGIIICNKCNRFYPIIEQIPHMLPDELREEKEDVAFLKKWRGKIPKRILEEGKPFNLSA